MTKSQFWAYTVNLIIWSVVATLSISACIAPQPSAQVEAAPADFEIVYQQILYPHGREMQVAFMSYKKGWRCFLYVNPWGEADEKLIPVESEMCQNR